MPLKDHEKFQENIIRILSTARKQGGLSQDHVAKKLGISQATYSHYEKGFREISGSTLAVFFSRLGVNPGCLKSGVLDDLRPATSILLHPHGSFKMPRSYLKSPGLNVRSIAPILAFCRAELSAVNTSNLFTCLGVDPLYFNVMDNQLNFDFFRDLCVETLQQAKVSTDEIVQKHFRGYSSHGLLHEVYSQAQNGIESVKKYMQCGDKYDDYFEKDLQQKKKNHWSVSFTPKSTIKKYAFSSALENRILIGDYFQSFLSALTQYEPKWPKITVEPIESTHDGGLKCEYLLLEASH